MIDEFSETERKSRVGEMLQKRRFRLALIWGIWTIVALFFSTQVFVMYYSENLTIPYARAFFVQASACYLWALMTPLVLWLAQRYRIDRYNWRQKVIFHIALSVVFTSIVILIHFVIYTLITGRTEKLTLYWAFNFLYPNLDRFLLVYWFIFLMSHAWNYYTSYREGELRSSRLRTQLA